MKLSVNPPSDKYCAPPRKSLYDRLGGIFAIAAVVDRFSDALIMNPIVGQNSDNPHLSEWHRNSLTRLPGLKWMRTLWVSKVTGGPYDYIATVPVANKLDLSKAHSKFKISSEEFDEVARVLKRTLNEFNILENEQAEVMNAFLAHKAEVIGKPTI